jgi:iron complex transport system substrate-binding protein
VALGVTLGLVVSAAIGGRAASAAAPEATKPIRVATLLPFVEDALALEPERVVVVASVRRSMREPLPPGLIDLGNPHSPNFERLVEANADLIVVDGQIHATLVPRLEALGAEVQVVDASGITKTLASLSALAARVGPTPRLDDRIAAVERQLESLRIERPVKVLPLFGAPGSFYAITERTWLGQLIATLGFENVAPSEGDERFPGLVVVSDEVLSTLQPDLVVLVAHGDPRKIQSDLAGRTLEGGAWASLRSAGYGIHVLDPGLFAANPGLDLDRAAADLIALVQAPVAAR